MEKIHLIKQLQCHLQEQKEGEKGTSIHFQKMNDILKLARVDAVNENFEGTLQEIHVFVADGQYHPNPHMHIQLHKLNISRWIEELDMLINGGGAVTIDYEQRKGREI